MHEGTRRSDVRVRREDDGETVGLLLPSPDGQWVPATIFGAPLGSATDTAGAEAVVRERGMSSLAEPWWVRVGGTEWRQAWLLEVKADRLRMRWENPMLMAGGHGEWVMLSELEIQQSRP